MRNTVAWTVLLVVALSVACQGSTPCNQTCDVPADPQRTSDALLELYNSLNGPNWRFPDGSSWSWGSDANCTDVYGRQYGSEYAYCCWEGVVCCPSPLDDALAGIHESWTNSYKCFNGSVWGLLLNRVDGLPSGHPSRSQSPTCAPQNVVYSGLTGTFPLVPLCALSCTLQVLSLQFNNLTGSLPAGLSSLQELRVLYLSYNWLTGKIPDFFDASYKNGLSELFQLDLSQNCLTGQLPADMCRGNTNLSSHLVDASFGYNQLTGSVDAASCNNLVLLGLENNLLTGGVTRVPLSLHIVRYQNNLMNGTVSDDLLSTISLSLFNAANNSLVGSIPDSFGIMDFLTIVDLSYNKLTGTIPMTMSVLGNLGSLSLNNNLLTSSIPSGIGAASSLTSLSLTTNYLTGTLPGGQYGLQNSTTLFLAVLDNYLSCCGRDFDQASKLYRDVVWNASRLPPWLLQNASDFQSQLTVAFMRCPSFSLYGRDGKLVQVSWFIDPSYYMYTGCICLDQYHLVNTSTPVGGLPWSLLCVADPSYWSANLVWIITVICVGGTILLLLLAFLCGQRAVLLRTYVSARKRIQGAPLSGVITVVVTDIEGYSDMMKQWPELMTRALNIHNAVIRKAKWANFGYTVEQEGDSFSIMFREAVDAASFCLMAQQAFLLQDWPKGLFHDATSDSSVKRSGIFRSVNDFAANVLHAPFPWSRQHQGSSDGPSPHVVSPDPHVVVQDDPLTASDEYADMVGALHDSDVVRLDANAINAGAGGSSSRSRGGRRRTRGGSQLPLLWCGVRVRMGMATGAVAAGSSIRSSAVMEEAKMVSDAGSGGQVLMEEQTFLNLKDRLEELGAVDHEGLNAAKLYRRHRWWHLWPKSTTEEAIVLDMGEYWHCPAGEMPLYAVVDRVQSTTPLAIRVLAEVKDECKDGVATLGAKVVAPPLTALLGAPAMRHLQTTVVNRNSPTPSHSGRVEDEALATRKLKLVQILAPCLAGRAKTFLNVLALKPEWLMADKPYFAAPGTAQAPLSSDCLSEALPDVTMVFAMVEGSKPYSLLYRKDARQVHLVCAAVIRTTLRHVEGGYLCRLQDGELKYMVCFATPQAALQWCLLVQQVLMYADWPESALKFDKFKVERAEDGTLLFRGPRMKMGVCEGVPKSIVPDHLGRADYHGASINQAARYMDAAAHGGQVVCEEALALKVFSVWGLERLVSTAIDRVSSPMLVENATGGGTSAVGGNGAASAGGGAGNVGSTGVGLSGGHNGGGGGRNAGSLSGYRRRSSGESQSINVHVDATPSSAGAHSRRPSATSHPPPAVAHSAPATAHSAPAPAHAATACPPTTDTATALPPLPPLHQDYHPLTYHHHRTPSAPTTAHAAPATATDSTHPPKAMLPPLHPDYHPLTSHHQKAAVPSAYIVGAPPQQVQQQQQQQAGQGKTYSPSRLGGRGAGLHVDVPMVYADPTNDSLLPQGQPRAVAAFKTGVFRFKGSPEDVPMAHVVLTSLRFRRFPADPPKGKGKRVTEASGLLVEGSVMMPAIESRYSQRYEFIRAEAGGSAAASQVSGSVRRAVTPSSAYADLGALRTPLHGSVVDDGCNGTPRDDDGSPAAPSTPTTKQQSSVGLELMPRSTIDGIADEQALPV